MAAVVDTGLLLSGLRSEFFDLYNVRDTAAWYQRFAMRIASTKDRENHRFLGSAPALRLWGDGRVAQGIRSERYDVDNQKYEATISVKRDELDDEQTNQIRPRIQQLSARAAQHKDDLLAQLLILGGSVDSTGTTYNSNTPIGLGYDGVSYFNTAHVSGNSGNQNNAVTTSISDGTNHIATVAEWRDIQRKMFTQMMAFKDDQGKPMMPNQPGAFTLLVHPANYANATEAAMAQIISQTTNVFQGLVKVAAWPWLATYSALIGSGIQAQGYSYLLYDGDPIKPMIFQDRMPIEFGMRELNSDKGWETEEYEYGVRARYAMAYGAWQFAIRNVS